MRLEGFLRGETLNTGEFGAEVERVLLSAGAEDCATFSERFLALRALRGRACCSEDSLAAIAEASKFITLFDRCKHEDGELSITQCNSPVRNPSKTFPFLSSKDYACNVDPSEPTICRAFHLYSLGTCASFAKASLK